MKRINPLTNKPFKRGDKNERGDYFFAYVKNKKIIDGYYFEHWIAQEKFDAFDKLASSGYRKTCKKCGQTKAIKEHFYTKYSSEDGVEPSCKTCQSAVKKKYWGQNKERHRELTEKWYVENKERHLAASKKIYGKNKKRKLLDYYRREERTKRATPIWADRNELLKFHKEAEALTIKLGEPYEVDHIIPLHHKLVCGLNVPANLQVITRTENRKKAAKWNPND